MKLLTPKLAVERTVHKLKPAEINQSAVWVQLKLSSSTTLRPLCDNRVLVRPSQRSTYVFGKSCSDPAVWGSDSGFCIWVIHERNLKSVSVSVSVKKINYLFICFYFTGFPGNAGTPGACRGKGLLRTCWTYSKTRDSSQIYPRLFLIFVHKTAKQMWLTEIVSRDVSSWNKWGNWLD